MFPKLIQAGLYSEGERDIYTAYIHQPHSHAHNQKGEGRPPLSFLKIEKSVLILERKTLIVSIFGLNVPFKMQFQEYIRKKVPKWLHVRPLFPAFLTKCLTKCPSSTNHHPPPSPLVMKNFWLSTCTQVIFFLQNAPSYMLGSVVNTSVSITPQKFV